VHPAGEHLDRDRLGVGGAYLLQVASLDPLSQPGQGLLQNVQVADHRPVVELVAAHHDLNPVVVIVQLSLRAGQPGHDMEGADVAAQTDLIGH
jgi:hypothetical protein